MPPLRSRAKKELVTLGKKLHNDVIAVVACCRKLEMDAEGEGRHLRRAP